MKDQENINKLIEEIEAKGNFAGAVERKLASIAKRKLEIKKIIKTYAIESGGKTKTLRVNEKIISKLEGEAEKNNITVTKYINIILASYILEDDLD